MKIEIEDNVNIDETRGRKSKYPVGELKVDQGFFVADGKGNSSSLRSIAHTLGKAMGRKFSVNKGAKEGVEGYWCKRIK